LWIQGTGLIVLLPVTVLLNDPLSVRAVIAGSIAGVAGVAGLISYFRAMASSPIGLVSPIAAAVSVAVPVLVGLVFLAETVSRLQGLGMLLGLSAIVLVAYQPSRTKAGSARRGVWLSVAAGVGFGLFYIALDTAPPDSGLWPVVAGRVSAILAVGLLIWRTQTAVSQRVPVGLLLAAGALDALAQGLFLAATRTGLLGIAVLLTSMFPVVAVLAGRYLLHEKLRRTQAFAVILALAAITLVVAG
jgi:drug/metabolite transporter (DMT)-like permease